MAQLIFETRLEAAPLLFRCSPQARERSCIMMGRNDIIERSSEVILDERVNCSPPGPRR